MAYTKSTSKNFDCHHFTDKKIVAHGLSNPAQDQKGS